MTSLRNVSGITLVELLVVIAIIASLVGLLIPAVQMARESSRRSSCANNVRQQAAAVLLHEGNHNIYPTGGWGTDWVGDPDKGFGTKQPGGWIYNILPFIEQQSLREIGKGLPKVAKRAAMVQLLETPLEVFHCPSRRLARAYPYKGPLPMQNADPPVKVAKSDYAISATISYEKSEVILSDIQLHGKGASNTILVGEKSISRESFTTGEAAGDQLTMYVGDCEDIRRQPKGQLVSDTTGSASSFGSSHPGGANIAYGDGSVRFVSEDENLEYE